MTHRYITALFLFGVSVGTSQILTTDQALSQRVDAYLTAYVSNNEFSGVALIATGDSILFKKSYGFVDVDSQQRFSVNTRFRVASVTKTFTAAAIVMLRDRGLLKLTDPLSRFIPDYPKGDSITIVHLLLPSGWNSNQRPQQA